MKIRTFLLLTLLCLCAANTLIGCRTFTAETRQSGNSELVENLDVILNVYRLIRNNYVDGDTLSSAEILERAAQGMTTALDPFSEYMPKRQAQSFQEETTGEFGGIGVVISPGDHGVKVMSTIHGTPADSAGIVAGDEIVSVDGQSLNDTNTEDASMRLRGPNGTAVKLEVRHGSTGETEEITLIRSVIPIETVVDVMVVPNTTVGYARITQFSLHTANDFKEALDRLEREKITGLIVDLRGNPGGLLEVVAKCCGYFLPTGSLIVSIEGRTEENNYAIHAEAGYKFPSSIPMAILIDRGSASAAEIMSACMKDYMRATLIGEKSFGKGSVQTVFDFENGASLKLTIARYFTPSHRMIHGVGVMPDFIQPLSGKEYMDLIRADSMEERFRMDANVQSALKFFATGTLSTLEDGEDGGDVEKKAE